MKNNRLVMLLALVLVVSACTTTAPLPPPVDTLGNTPAPTLAATDTLSDTPAPTRMVTNTPVNTPTTPNSGSPVAPIQHSALSTNGPYLAYLRSQGDQYEIVLTDANGVGQKIIPYPENASKQNVPASLTDTLSPDGKWLAFFTGSAGTCFGNGDADTADLTLNLLNLTDGQSQVATKLLSHDYPQNFAQAASQTGISADSLQNAFVCGIMQSLAWSPDGRTLAFAGQIDGLSSDLYLYDLASQTIRRMSSGSEEVQEISWSPDGRWIIDASSYIVGEGMTYDIYATSFDGKVVRKLVSSTCGWPGWQYGTIYFFSKCNNGVGNFDLQTVDVATGLIRQIWPDGFDSLAVSADHQWIVLISNRSGKLLSKSSSDPNFVPGLYLVNLATLERARVDVPGNFNDYRGPEAVGNGDRLFALLNAAENSLYFLSADGKLTPTGTEGLTFSVSPDRQTLAVFGKKIHLLKADGTPLRDIDLPANVFSESLGPITWRPDSSGLFFESALPSGARTVDESLYALDLQTDVLDKIDTLENLAVPFDPIWLNVPR